MRLGAVTAGENVQIKTDRAVLCRSLLLISVRSRDGHCLTLAPRLPLGSGRRLRGKSEVMGPPGWSATILYDITATRIIYMYTSIYIYLRGGFSTGRVIFPRLIQTRYTYIIIYEIGIYYIS